MNRRPFSFWMQARAMLVVMLFAPFVALQTLAQGTMLSATEDGMTLVLCRGGELVEVVLLDDGSIAPVEGQHGTVECPWATAQAAFTDIDAGGMPQVAGVEFAAVLFSEASLVAHVSAAALPPVRGPPGLV